MIMTEYEKMLHNLPYDYTDKEVQANILRAYHAMRDLNQCICPPFHCDHGIRVIVGAGSVVTKDVPLF